VPVHVAVAVIINNDREVLIALRHKDQHQGGLWEFPGGKVEPREHVYDALSREIKEELGLQVMQANPLIEVAHDYGDKSVVLDVWSVTEYLGRPKGCEGQSLRWCAIEALQIEEFPIANEPIITALQALDHISLV
jgi:8-oxo-dGTP diphosphatase